MHEMSLYLNPSGVKVMKFLDNYSNIVAVDLLDHRPFFAIAIDDAG